MYLLFLNKFKKIAKKKRLYFTIIVKNLEIVASVIVKINSKYK